MLVQDWGFNWYELSGESFLVTGISSSTITVERGPVFVPTIQDAECRVICTYRYVRPWQERIERLLRRRIFRGKVCRYEGPVFFRSSDLLVNS